MGCMKFGNGGKSASFDTTFQRPISATKEWDPPPLSAGVANVTTILVGACDGEAGARFAYGCPAPGDVVTATHSALGLSAAQLTAHVADGAGTVAVVLRNAGAAPLDVPAGTLRAVVLKFE